MPLPLNGILLLVLAVAAVFVAVKVRRLRSDQTRSGVAPDRNQALRRAVRWGMVLGGVGVSVAAAAALGQRAIFLFAPLALSGYVAGLLLGELLMPHAPGGRVRHGSLERRATDLYLGARWVWAWRFAAAAAVAAIGAAGIAGAPDGRSLALDCANNTSNVSSPWPGWSYGGPALIALLLGGLLVELSIRRAVLRPRPDPAVVDMAADDARRAASIRRTVAMGLAVALVPLAGIALGAAQVLSFMCSGPGQLGWTVPLAIALALLGLTAGIGALAGLASLIAITDDRVSRGPSGEEGGARQWS